MNDRELLEMAAKAARRSGIRLECPDDPDGIFIIRDEIRNGFIWNPLTDDGDALRLASRLCISITTGPCEARACTISGALRGFFPKESTIGVDQDSSVRRVIVRAAAEIGRSM